MVKIIYGQDNEEVNYNYLKSVCFEKGDIKYIKKYKKEVFDFVGFILDDNNITAVFPKHYFANSEIEYFNKNNVKREEDIKLLFNVMIKYIANKKSTAKANKYIGNELEYSADYPFAEFYKIYDYFRKYGLYHDSSVVIKPLNRGKVSWKNTIKKSQIIVSGGNIIYSQLYVKAKDKENVFITECMAFIIDNTIEKFKYFISLPKTGYICGGFEYFNNIEFVIKELYILKSKAFKDINISLINNIINFFKSYQKRSNGGSLHVKINYFDKVWEEMISKYLNDFFEDVDETKNEIKFNKSLFTSILNFNNKTLEIDNSYHNYKITIDHYATYDKVQYIFDSKYYHDIKNLNYKQFSYNEILRYYGGNTKFYSALILPGNKSKIKTHLSLKSEFIGERKNSTSIIEQYLDIKDVMINYLK